jgi:hypothetical protein
VGDPVARSRWVIQLRVSVDDPVMGSGGWPRYVSRRVAPLPDNIRSAPVFRPEVRRILRSRGGVWRCRSGGAGPRS